MSQDAGTIEIEKTETIEEKKLRQEKEKSLKEAKEHTLNAEEEIKLIAEWFFKQRVIKFGIDYIHLADGTNVAFMLDADNNLMDALESKMIEEAEIDHIGITFSRTDPENKVVYTYYKVVTSIGTSYMMSVRGRDSRNARRKALIKYLRRNTKL